VNAIGQRNLIFHLGHALAEQRLRPIPDEDSGGDEAGPNSNYRPGSDSHQFFEVPLAHRYAAPMPTAMMISPIGLKK
jgi:hypothetical protein